MLNIIVSVGIRDINVDNYTYVGEPVGKIVGLFDGDTELGEDVASDVMSRSIRTSAQFLDFSISVDTLKNQSPSSRKQSNNLPELLRITFPVGAYTCAHFWCCADIPITRPDVFLVPFVYTAVGSQVIPCTVHDTIVRLLL